MANNTIAFVDTTILANILLKTGPIKDNSLKALNNFTKSQLPVYAIKEFKAGPLHNFVYAHNKLVTLKSVPKFIAAISRLSLTPHKYKTATALEALSEASESISEKTTKEHLDKYGITDIGSILFDETRIALKVRILKAWKRRRKVTTDIVHPIHCYKEVSPQEKRGGLLDDKPTRCSTNSHCLTQEVLKTRPDEVQKVRDAIDINSLKKEDQSRRKVLKSLFRTPKREIDHNECRHIGDAVFAILAPEDTTILTTNIKDHEPLASALGKKVACPNDYL